MGILNLFKPINSFIWCCL